jgi:superfamily II DNA/RNA helicase
MDDFRRGTCSLLVATDVASRGLDVKDIRMVM